MLRAGLWSFVLLPLLPLVVGGCSVFGDRSGTEQVHYDVIERIGENVEIRRYGERRAVETAMAGGSGSNNAFRRLFGFISGDNEDEQKISMTAPVQMGDGSDGRPAMRFFMPASMDAVPDPGSGELAVVMLPARTEAVLSYSGLYGWRKIGEKEAELRAALEGSGWRPVGQASGYYYDPPWTLPWFRLNEVSIEAVPADGADDPGRPG